MRVRRLTRAATACLAGLWLCACPADPRDAEQGRVVAHVGDVGVREVQFIAALAQRGVARIPDAKARMAIAQTILDRIVEEELLLLGAQHAGVTVSNEDVEREVRNRADGYPPGLFQRTLTAEQLTNDEFRNKVRRRLVGDAFLRAKLSQLPAIPEAEVRARYDEKYKDVKRPATVRARQVLVRTNEEASHILEQIRGRKLTVEAAASKFSTAPEAEQGGDLGWFAQGELPKVFDVCFLLAPSQISDVISSEYGFHIFQVVERRPERVEPFEALRPRIEADLARDRQSEAMKEIIDELRRTTKVTTSAAAVQRVVAMIPQAPPQPSIANDPGEGTARALDAHPSVDPIPPVPRPPKAKE